MAAVTAAQPQKTVGQDAALDEGVELVFDEPGQLGAGAGLGVGDEAGRVLVHQAVQRGLLGAVALVRDRSAIGYPTGLLHRGLHALFASSRRPADALNENPSNSSPAPPATASCPPGRLAGFRSLSSPPRRGGE
jgi:hypothetical protein